MPPVSSFPFHHLHKLASIRTGGLQARTLLGCSQDRGGVPAENSKAVLPSWQFHGFPLLLTVVA